LIAGLIGLQLDPEVSCQLGGAQMNLTIEVELETDGRWIAEVPELPGVLAYGSSQAEAMARAEVLALRVLAERIEHGEAVPMALRVTLPTAA
jgi:predicted RNase H-like HicB family nuclease